MTIKFAGPVQIETETTEHKPGTQGITTHNIGMVFRIDDHDIIFQMVDTEVGRVLNRGTDFRFMLVGLHTTQLFKHCERLPILSLSMYCA